MKRFLLLILVLLLTFSINGCVKPKYETDGTEIVVLPNAEAIATVNGYKAEASNKNESDNTPTANTKEETKNEDKSQSPESSTYIANTSTKKFHTSACQYAKKIKDENLLKGDSRTTLINGGYEPCKKCNP